MTMSVLEVLAMKALDHPPDITRNVILANTFIYPEEMVRCMLIRYAGKNLDPGSGALTIIRRRFGDDIAQGYGNLLLRIARARNRLDLEAMRSLRHHPLKGDRKGEWAINPRPRTNVRVIVRYESGQRGRDNEEIIIILRIEDYH